MQHVTTPGRTVSSAPRRPVQRVDPDKWATYFQMLLRGAGKNEAAQAAGIAYNTALRLHQDPKKSSGYEQYKQWLANDLRDVVPEKELSRQAKRALVDFEYFRLRYFGHISMPWHIKAAEVIVKALESPDKEFLVVNCPPGSGKSTLMTHDIVTWALVRNRALRVMIGTKAATTGADYTTRIKNSLDRILPVEADEIEKALGLATDAEATLLQDFGRFKPEGTGYWRADKLVLARAGGVPAHQKEASLVSFGEKSGFLGGRYNLVIWDDVVTDQNCRTPAQQEELARWWRTTAESRLEPGGVLVLQGQRMSAHDLYRHVLDLRDITQHLDGDYDPEKLPSKYTHIKFPAHDDAKCKGGDSKHRDHDAAKAKPWPKGCLLDPKRLTYRDLRVAEYNDPRSYATVYQQEDTDPGSVLVNPAWIAGGQDPITGEHYPGCWDKDRHVGQLPQNLAGDVYSVVTADPSPTMYWGAMWWLYQPSTDFDHLIDIERRKMQAPDFLDWNHATGEFSGLLEDWWQTSRDLGRPITHVIVEANAAQRFLLQYDHAKRWTSMRGVQLYAHTTTRNKSDAALGVQTLGPHYRHGKVRLPGHWASRGPVMALYNEVTRYPDSATTDLVMAHWFLRFQSSRLFLPQMDKPYAFNRPDWVRNRHRGLGVVAS